jgi:hypothetical protein
MKTLTKTVSLLAALTITLFITSCKKNEGTSEDLSAEDSLVISSPITQDPTPPPPSDTYSHVQFINANTSVGPLTLYVAGVKSGAGLNLYGEERGYENTTASVQRESVVIKSATGSTVKSTSSGFYAGNYYTLLYVGEKSNQQALLYNDNRPATAPAAGTALIKFINAAPAAPLLDVVINNKAIITRQGFTGCTGYVTVAAGTYTINFNAYNTTNVVASIPTAVIQSGKVYTVYTRDDLKGGKVAVAGDIYTVE